jgi:hypothetical protein
MKAHSITTMTRPTPKACQRSVARVAGCLVAVLLATTSLAAATAWGASGGLPGTGDRSFNPAGNTGDNHYVSPEGVDANELLGISEQLVLAGACDVVQAGESLPHSPAPRAVREERAIPR